MAEMYLIGVSTAGHLYSLLGVMGLAPSDYCNRLRDGEANSLSHVQQKEHVGDEGHGQLNSVDDGEPSTGVSRAQLGSIAERSTHQAGSGRKVALSMSVFGGHHCLHWRTKAQMLKAEATGPRVPAIMGNADEANHQRLHGKLSVDVHEKAGQG